MGFLCVAFRSAETRYFAALSIQPGSPLTAACKLLLSPVDTAVE